MNIPNTILSSNTIGLSNAISDEIVTMSIIDLYSSPNIIQDGFMRKMASSCIKGYIVELAYSHDQLSGDDANYNFIKSLKDTDQVFLNKYTGTIIENKLIFNEENEELSKNSIILKVYIGIN